MSSFEEAAAQAAAEFAGTNSTAIAPMAPMDGSFFSTLEGVIMSIFGFLSTVVGGIMPLLGFTSSGIAAGSTAAATQSTIGNVASGTWFAGFQSFGAIGGFHLLMLGGAVVGVVGSFLLDI